MFPNRVPSVPERLLLQIPFTWEEVSRLSFRLPRPMRLDSMMGFYKGAWVQSLAAPLFVYLKGWNTWNWHSRGGLIEPHKFLTRPIFER